MKEKSLKKLPPLLSDEEAENFIDTADLSEYDLSDFSQIKFEFEPKASTINMRLPQIY